MSGVKISIMKNKRVFWAGKDNSRQISLGFGSQPGHVQDCSGLKTQGVEILISLK